MAVQSVLLAALAVSSLYGASALAAVTGAEHSVQNGPIKPYVWGKFAGAQPGKKVVVLAHGSATAGRESFDLQIPGMTDISLMDVLAEAGFDVFALGTRGFGLFTHPEGRMTTAEASKNLNAVVDYIAKLHGVPKVDLLAWSWVMKYGGMFVLARPEKVNNYIAYAPMHLDSTDLAKHRQRLDAFRRNPYAVVPEAGWKPRFYSMTPASVNNPGVVNACAHAAALVETRTATGPQLDMVTIRPMLNARSIAVPLMLIHEEFNDVTHLAGCCRFSDAPEFG
jgi:pimeloyl-ACP methyl ester carboxylesterase